MTLYSYKNMYSEIQKDAVVSTKWFFGRLLDGQRKWRHRAAQEWCGQAIHRSMMGRLDYLLFLKGYFRPKIRQSRPSL